MNRGGGDVDEREEAGGRCRAQALEHDDEEPAGGGEGGDRKSAKGPGVEPEEADPAVENQLLHRAEVRVHDGMRDVEDEIRPREVVPHDPVVVVGEEAVTEGVAVQEEGEQSADQANARPETGSLGLPRGIIGRGHGGPRGGPMLAGTTG